MSQNSVIKVLLGLLNRGAGSDDDTSLFTDLSHDAIIQQFVAYLNAHRHFIGSCHIEESHALNDKGVDILLAAADCKVGFQLKSHFDVTEDAFAANVKRQWAESHAHGLDHYFILICSPLKQGSKNYSQRISHILNELSQMKTAYHTAFGPKNAVQFFRGLPPLTREELLLQRAITDDCLHDYERGYEHLPEVSGPEIEAADKALAAFGDDWPESDAGQSAYDRYIKAVQAKEAEQFLTTFLPTLPPDVRRQREELVAAAQRLLVECRACKSWRDRSESKLPQWLDNVPEQMIPYTSLPNLLRITADLRRYLEIHQGHDAEMGGEQSDPAHAGTGTES
jgi:hypothetical protein